MFRRTISGAQRLMNVERASVLLVDNNMHDEVLRIVSSTDANGLTISISRGIAGAVVQTGHPVMVNDAYSDERFDKTVDQMTGFRTHNVLAVPVVIDDEGSDRVVAILEVLNKRDCKGATADVVAFCEDDRDLLEVMANFLSCWYSRASQLDANLSQRRQMEALLAVVEALRQESLPYDCARSVARAIEHGCECEHAALYFLDRANSQLCCVTEIDPVNGSYLRLPADVGLSKRILEEGKSIVMENVQDGYPDFDRLGDRLLGIETRSLIAVPVRRRSKVVGYIESINAVRGEILPEQVKLLQTIAAQLTDTLAAPLMAEIIARSGRTEESDEETTTIGSAILSEFSHRRATFVKKSRRNSWRNSSCGDSRLKERRSSFPSLTGLSQYSSSLGNLDDNSGLNPRGNSLDEEHANSSPDVAKLRLLVDEDGEDVADTLRKRLGAPRPTRKRSLMYRRGSLAAGWNVPTRLTLSAHIQPPHGVTVADLQSWSLDVFRFQQNELCQLAAAIFDFAGVLHDFKISHEILSSFISVVSSRYRLNPYHNWQHAISVLHATHLLSRVGVSDVDSPRIAEGPQSSIQVPRVNPLDRLHLLALLISAICHDVDHPGVSNQFLINTSAPLALCYNDESVLENHHTATTFSILADPANNLLKNISLEDRKLARRLICKTILSTDMAKHQDLVKLLTNIAADSKPVEPVEALQFYMHLADLSNAVLEQDQARRWAFCVISEFRQQAERETELGMEVAPHMRKLDTAYDIANLQLGFLDFVVIPLWKAASLLFPAVKERLPQLLANRESWYEEKALESGRDSIRESPSSSRNSSRVTSRRGSARPLSPPLKETSVSSIDRESSSSPLLKPTKATNIE